MGSLVLGYQPARAGIRPVIQQQPVDVLVSRVVVPGDVLQPLVVGLEGDVRLLLAEQLVEGLALLLLLRRRSEPDAGRPPFRRSNPPVERVVSRVPLQRVGRVLYLVIREVSGLVAGLVGHLCLLSVAPLGGRARRPDLSQAIRPAG